MPEFPLRISTESYCRPQRGKAGATTAHNTERAGYLITACVRISSQFPPPMLQLLRKLLKLSSSCQLLFFLFPCTEVVSRSIDECKRLRPSVRPSSSCGSLSHLPNWKSSSFIFPFLYSKDDTVAAASWERLLRFAVHSVKGVSGVNCDPERLQRRNCQCPISSGDSCYRIHECRFLSSCPSDTGKLCCCLFAHLDDYTESIEVSIIDVGGRLASCKKYFSSTLCVFRKFDLAEKRVVVARWRSRPLFTR